MSRTRTSWEDLSNLGWPKQQVYNKLNAQRGGTMQGLGDIALNEGFALDYAWYCYNDFTGSPQAYPPNINSSVSDTVVWEYKNTTNQEFKDTWTESWENTERVDSSVSTSATIEMNSSVTISGVFNTGFSFSFQANSSQSQFKEDKQSLSHTWDFIVPAGGHRRLTRRRTITTGTQDHRVKYGLASGADRIGTKGKIWDGHYYWAYGANYYLNNPSGTMVITSFLNQKSFLFIYEDVYPDGRRVEIPIELPSIARSSHNEGTSGTLTRLHAKPLGYALSEPVSGPGGASIEEVGKDKDEDKKKVQHAVAAGNGKKVPVAGGA